MVLEKSFKHYEIIPMGSGIQNTLWDLFNFLSSAMNYEKSPTITQERDGDIKHMSISNKRLKNIFDWTPSINLADGVKSLV